jgi:hypothetical protein
MRCEDALGLLQIADGSAATPERRRAAEHATTCASCADALRALQALRAERARPVPVPAGAFERALVAATRRPVPARSRTTFWLGAAVGAAAAAAVTIAALLVWSEPASIAASVPEVLLAVNEPRDVSITLDSPVALAGARISVTLNGAVELSGFAGQRRLEWSTDLASGVNQLTLPVVALGSAGGQVAVEVAHGDRRRVFIVDVRANRGPAPAGV